MACCQCHTHKYDAITQEEYLQLFAVLNNTEDAQPPAESPLFAIGDTPEKMAKRTALEKQLATLDKSAKFQPALIQGALKLRTDPLRKQIDALKPTTTVPVLRELPKKRVTKLQYRG